MNLTEQEKQIIANILSQVSIPVKESPAVLEIIRKLQLPPENLPVEPETD